MLLILSAFFILVYCYSSEHQKLKGKVRILCENRKHCHRCNVICTFVQGRKETAADLIVQKEVILKCVLPAFGPVLFLRISQAYIVKIGYGGRGKVRLLVELAWLRERSLRIFKDSLTNRMIGMLSMHALSHMHPGSMVVDCG